MKFINFKCTAYNSEGVDIGYNLAIPVHTVVSIDDKYKDITTITYKDLEDNIKKIYTEEEAYLIINRINNL